MHVTQTTQILRTVATHQHRGIRNGAGDQGAQIGQAGARVQQYVPIAQFTQMVNQLIKQITPHSGVVRQQMVPLDVKVQRCRIGSVAVGGQDGEVVERGVIEQAVKQLEVTFARRAQFVFLPFNEPVKETRFDRASIAQGGDVV